MRRVGLLAFFLFLVAAGSSKELPGPAHEGIYIDGPRTFRENIERALRLIERGSPEQFACISRNVKRIRLTRSRIAPDVAAYCDKSQCIYIVRDCYRECLEQAAAHPMAFHALPCLIVHETVHLQQILEGRDPTSVAAESEALQAEKVLRSRLAQPPK